jgi:hypothetical protein
VQKLRRLKRSTEGAEWRDSRHSSAAYRGLSAWEGKFLTHREDDSAVALTRRLGALNRRTVHEAAPAMDWVVIGGRRNNEMSTSSSVSSLVP